MSTNDPTAHGKNARIKGRGAVSNPAGRFEHSRIETLDDGWYREPEPAAAPATEIKAETARSILSHNHSPDIPFAVSINPYRGCEHGCIYCYARPSHAYLGLSPGLDFETRLFYKHNAAELLQQALRKPTYRCQVIHLGANTDPYQPMEGKLGITRALLRVMQRCKQPLTIVTKGSLIGRDMDILTDMARHNLAAVMISVTTLDDALKRRLEPRATSPRMRLRLIERLSAAGIPVGVLVAPVIPRINDAELERILAQAAAAGARWAQHTLLRLPHEVADLFADWLTAHFPQRAAAVMRLVRHTHGGKTDGARFHQRMHGSGAYAAMLGRRFTVSCRKLGLSTAVRLPLDTTRFKPPAEEVVQLDLF